MRLFIALVVVVASAAALPMERAADVEPALDGGNATFRADTRGMGMAAFGEGTTGGHGGAHWVVWDAWALRDALAGNDRRVVEIMAPINLDQLFVAPPGVRIDVGAHKTIRGGNPHAIIYNGGLRIGNVHNVIVENIRFHNAISYANHERPDGFGGIHNIQHYEYSEIDAIEVTNSHHVWINHCEFADDPWNGNNGPGGWRRHDGQVDIVRGSNFVTVSNNLFRNHEFVMLIGNGDGMDATDSGRLHTSIALNWFRGNQRQPRVRFGRVHVLNNLYDHVSFYGIGVGHHASVFAERNVFVGTPRGWQAAGTTGHLRNEVNLFHSGSGFIGADIGNNVPWLPSQFFHYQSLAIGNVEAHVRRYAGIW